MKLFYYGVLSIFLIVSFNSCYYDKFDAIHPLDGYRNPCDSTADSSYTKSIKYVMANNCTTCHNKNFSQGDVLLDTYAGVVEQAQNGQLMGSVRHKSGYNAMPPGTTIPDCQIDKLQQWVDGNEPQ